MGRVYYKKDTRFFSTINIIYKKTCIKNFKLQEIILKHI